jgi:hypothetical protein
MSGEWIVTDRNDQLARRLRRLLKELAYGILRQSIDGERLEYRESVENPPYLPKPTGQMEAPFPPEH